MKSREIKHYVEIARQVALAGGAEALKYFRSKNLLVESKSMAKFDPVTLADKRTEEVMRSAILANFPEDGIIGEEHENISGTSGIRWVIDPIDGTRSFVIGNPTWSNLISLNYKGNPIFGLANFPKLNKYYYNSSYKKAFVVENGKKKKLKVNKKVNLKTIKVAGAFHGWLSLNKQKKIPKILKYMQFPCADALSYAHLCEGRIDVVMQCQNKIWDIHPLIPIIKASGGVFSTWDNKDAKLGGSVLISTNKKVHKQFLKFLKPAL